MASQDDGNYGLINYFREIFDFCQLNTISYWWQWLVTRDAIDHQREMRRINSCQPWGDEWQASRFL